MDEEAQRIFREQYELREQIRARRKALEMEVKKTSYQLDDPHVREFQWKGHDMVLLANGYGDHAVGGTFHDPECRKCKEEHKVNNTVEEPTVQTPEEELSDYEKVFGKTYDRDNTAIY